jgi:hypothetical protein
MTLNLNFNQQDWERIKTDWQAWWAHDLDRPLVYLDNLDPAVGSWSEWYGLADDLAPGDNPEPHAILDGFERLLNGMQFFGDAFPKWFPYYGPGIFAALLGGTPKFAPGTVWFDALGKPLDEISLSYSPDHPWRKKILGLLEAAAGRWGGQVFLGATDIGGNLDLLASLRGSTGLLMDLVERKAMVTEKIAAITQLWLRWFDEMYAVIAPTCGGCSGWAPFWAPGRFYMLQSDLSYMISPRMFERFVLPDLHACCEALDYPFYHLDGAGQINHLDLLLSLEKLRGIQWIPGAGSPPPQEWLPLLKRIRDGGKLCQVYVSAEGALRIARELGGKGFLFVIDYRMDGEQMTPEEAEAFLKMIRDL